MSASTAPRILSIAPGVPFLQTLAKALVAGELVPGFTPGGDPLALSGVTIYVPTRRAARSLRSLFVEQSGATSAILPLIRPLGEFDEDEALFDADGAAALDLAPPIAAMDRLLHLAGLVRAWKRRLPAHVAELFQEEMVVPASAADALWLARDLAALMDEIETEGSDWARLAGLAPEALSGWWQVTLEFLTIVTEHWPLFLAGRDQSNPAAHRSALIRLEAERLRRNPPTGPVVAAGSTGSIPATAELLSVIARLPNGAVVLPGLDTGMEQRSWDVLTAPQPRPAVLGHPQYGLAKLLRTMGALRRDVIELGRPEPALATRAALVSEALRPAETTDSWAESRSHVADLDAALASVTLVEAPRERDEAAAIAIALRQAVEEPGRTAALVTGDRDLARRVAAELRRFGMEADDSGGKPLAATPPAALLSLLLETAVRPGDPLPILALLKHPLLLLGLERGVVRRAAETIELVALRGGTGRPDIAGLRPLFDARFTELAGDRRQPFWLARMSDARLDAARDLLDRLAQATQPLQALRDLPSVDLAQAAQHSVQALEALARDGDGSLAAFYSGDAGDRLAAFLRGLVAAEAPFDFAPTEWPDIVRALIAPEMVKPSQGADRRIAIWGALEARLQRVDTLVIGGLNEGNWPRKAEADRFMSRMMKTGIELEPPERRIGQAAHDFAMAMGTPTVILTRSARSGEAPAVASRWLQRLLTFAGKDAADAMLARGATLLAWARELDASPNVDFERRPNPKPPVASRPTHFSVTEIETLRRDPYAVYARRILKLTQLEPLVRDPEAAERGTLIHEILNRFSASGIDPSDPAALDTLLDKGRECFAEAALPDDVEAMWWPRFERLAPGIIAWEMSRTDVKERKPEARAGKTPVGATGVTLSGYADRIDLLPADMADIVDYKTGSSPSKAQAHTLLAPQLALEGALMRRGAFTDVGKREPADLAFVRLKPNGEVAHESILAVNRQAKSAQELSEDAWSRLEKLLFRYQNPDKGYLSRALPFREGETDGEYDHLARVLEWSAGGDGPGGDGSGE